MDECEVNWNTIETSLVDQMIQHKLAGLKEPDYWEFDDSSATWVPRNKV